jgi:hypothetical protein
MLGGVRSRRRRDAPVNEPSFGDLRELITTAKAASAVIPLSSKNQFACARRYPPRKDIPTQEALFFVG